MVLVLCTSPDDALYLFMKISQRVFELLPGHEIMTDRPTDRQTDGQSDGQGDYYKVPPTSSGGALIIVITLKFEQDQFTILLSPNFSNMEEVNR